MYPIHILPQPDYLAITPETVISLHDEWLLRYVTQPAHTFIYEKDGKSKLHTDILTDPQTDHIAKRMSVSLYGIFKTEDVAWRPIKGLATEHSKQVHKEWTPGCESRVPTPEEYYNDSSYGYWRIPIGLLNGKLINVEGIPYTCSIKHQPTVCNYWHFELHICNSNGELPIGIDKEEEKYFQKLRKKIAKILLPTLVENAKAEVPKLDDISFEKELYRQKQVIDFNLENPKLKSVPLDSNSNK